MTDMSVVLLAHEWQPNVTSLSVSVTEPFSEVFHKWGIQLLDSIASQPMIQLLKL